MYTRAALCTTGELTAQYGNTTSIFNGNSIFHLAVQQVSIIGNIPIGANFGKFIL